MDSGPLVHTHNGSGHSHYYTHLPSSSPGFQPRAVDEPCVRDDLSSKTVFRLHILGRNDWDASLVNETDVERLVGKAFDIEPDTKITVKSLADHPTRKALVATVYFSQIPAKISRTSRYLQEFEGTVDDLSLDLDTHFYGFTPLHSRTSARYTYDVIALSGLGGHAFGSFKCRDKDFMWLRDDLPREAPNARIFVYGYDTELQGSTSFQSLEDLGLTFKDALVLLRGNTRNNGFPKPLVLLSHSLGGLVLKEALCLMSISPNVDEEQLLRSIRAILFFGTPNHGMDIRSLIPMVEGQVNENFLYSLGTDSTELRRQGRQWSALFDHPTSNIISNLEITSYYETATSQTAVKVDGRWKMSGPPTKLVDRVSATNGRPWKNGECFVQAINRDHSGLVKFRNRTDPVYSNSVLPRLQSYLSKDEYERSDLRLNEEEKACLSSLDFPERTSRQDQIVTARESTCEWLLENQTYRSWLHGSGGLLWLKGHPGTGKSTLTKHAVEARKAHASSEHVVFTHFFHGRGSEIQRSALGLVRSLVCQLLENFSTGWTEIMKKYKKTHRPIWEREWLGSFLGNQLRQSCKEQPIIIFIDALDECEEDDRDYLGDLLVDTVRGHVGASLKIFVSCRHYPNLFSGGFRIDTEINNADDIAIFVESKLRIMQENKRLILAKEIINNARGSFQWAKIVTIESVKLHRKGHSAAGIQEKIRQLPKEIHDLYDRLFQDADAEELRLACRLFHWLCFAEQPLCIRQLQFVIMLSPDSKESTIEEIAYRQDFKEDLCDMVNTITEVSRGLAEILVSNSTRSGEESERDETHLTPSWTSTVQLIHQTVTDYLFSTGLQSIGRDNQGRHEFSWTGSNDFIFRSCLRCMMMSDFVNQNSKRVASQDKIEAAAISRNLLLSYARRFLTHHLLEASSETDDQKILVEILGWPYNKTGLANFARANLMGPLMETFIGGDLPLESFQSPGAEYSDLLYWAVRENLPGVVKSIVQHKLEKSQEEVHPSHTFGYTPLPEISYEDYRQEMFINGYYNVNLGDFSCSRSALRCAINNGYANIVRELMKSPVINPNIMGSATESPLHYAYNMASSSNKREIMKHLLDHPKTNTRLWDRNGNTVLANAVAKPDAFGVRIILEADKACVNAESIMGDTPLSRVTRDGYVDFVKLLVDLGDCTKKTLQDAYDGAQYWGKSEIMQILAQTGLVGSRTVSDIVDTDG